MKIKLTLYLMALLTVTLPSSTAAKDSKVALDKCGLIATTSTAEPISAFFSQERKIRGLQRTLKSSGTFKLDPGEEIVWVTKKPIESKVVVNANGIKLSSSSANSKEPESHSDAKFRELSAILLEIHSLTLATSEKLLQRFTLDCYSNTDGTFLIEAKPRARSLKRVLEAIRIQGVDRPLQITISDSRKDETTINFEYPSNSSEQNSGDLNKHD